MDQKGSQRKGVVAKIMLNLKIMPRFKIQNLKTLMTT